MKEKSSYFRFYHKPKELEQQIKALYCKIDLRTRTNFTEIVENSDGKLLKEMMLY